MRKFAACAITASVIALLALPGSAQESPGPLDPVLDHLANSETEELVASFITGPVEEKSHLIDLPGDFEHSTGLDPGYTPDHVDILETWAIALDAGTDVLLGPTSAGGMWGPTGHLHVETRSYPDGFDTFTGEIGHDGSQLREGALLFGLSLADTPPIEANGRCEYAVWVNDLSRGPTFVNHPSFPGDPATGSNLVFGLVLNPEDDGVDSTFTLTLDPATGFTPDLEWDIRSFITTDYVAILAPRSIIGELGGINFYSFCSEEGTSIEAANTGADQTGLTELMWDDLAVMTVESQPLPNTTTTTRAATTTEPESTNTTSLGETGLDSSNGLAWLLIPIVAVAVAAVAWLVMRRRDPCRELASRLAAAKREHDAALVTAEKAEDTCMEAEFELDDLEEQRAALCRAWPPACWESIEGDWIEDETGVRISGRDRHLRRVALGELWAKYEADRVDKATVDARWDEIDTPAFRDEMKETDQAFIDLIEQIDSNIVVANHAYEEMCQKAKDARARADGTSAIVEQARSAYEACVASTEKTGAQPGTGGEIQRRYDRAGPADQIRVNLDFSIVVGRHDHSTGEGDRLGRLVISLDSLARDLGFSNDLIEARMAGLHIGGDLEGYVPGRYVATSEGVVQGGIDSATGTADTPTATIASPPDVLGDTGRVGEYVVERLTEWTGDGDAFTLRRGFDYQVITAVPFDVMEHRGESQWACVEKVWEFTVSRVLLLEGTNHEFTLTSAVRRAHFLLEARRLAQTAADAIRGDSQRLIEWRARHEPGPCR